MRVAYYVPVVPSVPSTARYNHALALAESAEQAILLTHEDPPEKIANAYGEVRVIPGSVTPSAGNLSKVSPRLGQGRRAARIADRFLDPADAFVTTFHYAPALAGYLADAPWVLDLYDDPYQYIYNSPRSMQEVLARFLRVLLGRADRAVHTIHPSSPRLFGADRRFALNGAPTEVIEPGQKPPRDPLRCVWAGKPRLDRGMELFLRALARSEPAIEVDVYGAPVEDAGSFAERLGVADDVTFRGQSAHETVRRAIGGAHVGLCLLPRRGDWEYSYPIKVGEYLAGGTVPLCSGFPGMRSLARGAGVYVEPAPAAIERGLEALATTGSAEAEQQQERCRSRAEAVSWDDERAWFAGQALDGNA